MKLKKLFQYFKDVAKTANSEIQHFTNEYNNNLNNRTLGISSIFEYKPLTESEMTAREQGYIVGCLDILHLIFSGSGIDIYAPEFQSIPDEGSNVPLSIEEIINVKK